MQDSDFFLLQELYTNQLATLEGTNFTQREIDVMACLVHARGTSKIASILAVSSHTVVTHVRNIMSKLNCSSRENIIDFVERSKKSSLFKKYYACLVLLRDFEKSLTAISRLKEKKNSACLLICGNYQKYPKAFFQHLENHLKQAGLEVVIQKQDFAYTPMIPSNKILLFFVKTEDFEKASKNFADFESIELGGEINYYFSVFAILEKLFLDKTLDSIIAEFKKIYERVETPLEKPHSLALLSEKTGKHLWHQPLPFVKSKVTYGGLALLLVILVGIGFLYPSTHKSYIRSDLVFPTEAVLLDRSEIISRIDRGLKARSGIQTAALVGPGGAGKTTLARQYAHQQKANVIWEINAETHENLKSSFENLAQALSKTKEDKEILREIQETKDPLARENKILRFVKEHLKEASNWLLIFDNMEKFIDIQKYFPHDFKTWGQGKIIITTRDANIQNNRHINTTLQIGELDPSQKLFLFSKIMNSGGKEAFSNSEKKEAMAFLEKIPPYPLDISIAAYYLKSTHTSYSKYLDMLGAYSQDFAKVQENLLKEAGDYTKTRYGIITLSLDNLIESHRDFKDLLLFISLLDSQNIPKDLLKFYKKGEAVDNFIFNLKKYSLIIDKSSGDASFPTLSLHRSTQAIILAYLTKTLKLKEKKSVIDPATLALEAYVESALEKGELSKLRSLIAHLEAFLSHERLLSDSHRGLLESELGYIYSSLTFYKQANDFFDKALLKLKKTGHQNDAKIAQNLLFQGNDWTWLGDFKKAENALKESISIYKKSLVTNNAKLALGLVYLANVYKWTGDYEKTKQLLLESLALYKNLPPQDNAGQIMALAFLGDAYRRSGDYKKAINITEKARDFGKKYLPASSFHRGWPMAILGLIHLELGNYEKTITLFNQGVALFEKNLSKSHFFVGAALLELGKAYCALGHYEYAIELTEKAFLVYKKVNINNFFFGCTEGFLTLGDAYKSLKDYEKAKNYLNKGLMIYESHYGKDHTETAAVLQGLGSVYLLEGNIRTAEVFLGKALSIYQKKKHPNVYKCLEDFADLHLKKSGDAAHKKDMVSTQHFKTQAADDLRQALEIVKTHFPDDSPHIIRVQSKLKKLNEG